VSKREKKLEGTQQGARDDHAEGQHGAKTHRKFMEDLHEPLEPADDNVIARDTKGRHRLFEDRQQHDEADKNSELGRERKEQQRGRTTSEGNEIHGGKPGGTPGQF
jgi:hypothetical protein